MSVLTIGIYGALFVITPEYVRSLIEELMDILSKEKNVQDLNSNCTLFIGDIHGDYSSWSIIRRIIEEKNALTIFLGDYVDRGANSLEVITEIMEMKNSDPRKFILLRGNHETRDINEYYGFLWELRRKFPSSFATLYTMFNELFSQMPAVAVIDNIRVLCLHGGIPIQVKSVDDLRDLPKGQIDVDDPILLQILWNDPDDSIENYAPSPRGPGIYIFGRKIFENFMRNSELQYLIRGHTYLPEGFRYFFNRKLLSIFSPLNYVGSKVKGKIAMFCNDDLEVIDLLKHK